VDVHDLTAAYALHALEDVERETYEAHLAQCEACREELALLTESAAALAWAVESPEPPARLRERILDEAAVGRANVVPLVPRRRLWQSAAAVAACAAIGLGIWAATLSNALHDERSHVGALSIVADPNARKAQLRGGTGTVAVTSDGRGVLVVDRLPAAPNGKTYEAWVIPPGGKPQRAGTFDGGDGLTMVMLDTPVMQGAVVAATVEQDGGVDQPSSKPLLSAQT
jgi:anti-sigma-K factor RskA